MEQYPHGSSTKAEFLLVVLGAFGYFIFGSLLSICTVHTSAAISEEQLRFLLLYEIVVLAALGGMLYLRGWTPGKLGLIPNLKDTAIGILLASVIYFACLTAWFIVSVTVPELVQGANDLIAPDLRLLTVIAVSILNPIFEEVFVCAYVITALRKTRSITFAVNVSIAIRLLYHLYQGANGVILIIPLGLVYSYWFARTGRLWPVVVSHALFDFLAFIGHVQP